MNSVILKEKVYFYKEPKKINKYNNKEVLKYAIGTNLYMNGFIDFYGKIVRGDLKGIGAISICFEDAIRGLDVNVCEKNVRDMLEKLKKFIDNNKDFSVPLIYVRVRNFNQFKSFVEGTSKECLKLLSGFIFPKFNSSNGEKYLNYLDEVSKRYNEMFYAMPIIESEEVIYKETRLEELIKIKRIVDKHNEKILNIRVGGTDFSSKFGLRRSKYSTIYDIKVVSECLIDVVNIFTREDGNYIVSGVVWEYFSEDFESMEIKGLIEETRLDKENGFIGKTIIHPLQAKYINYIYAVEYEEYIDAVEIVKQEGDGGVFKGCGNNKMNEIKPHMNWAKKILARAEVFGVLKANGRIEDIN